MKLKTLFLIVLLLTIPAQVFAAWRFYIVPVIGSGTAADCRRPKYVRPNCQAAPVAPYSFIDYGFEGIGLVLADTTVDQDSAVTAQPDVFRIPDNLDQTLGGAATAIQTKLESWHLPGDWVTGATTYRTLIKVSIGVFLFVQRYISVSGNNLAIITGAVTLNTQFGSLSLKARQDLSTAAKQLKLDTSQVTGTTTVREMLKMIGNQAINKTWRIRGIVL